MTERCPDCGRSVPTIFQHVDADCISEEFGHGWNDYRSGVGLFRGMKRYTGEAQTRYIQGWMGGDDVQNSATANHQGT